MDAVTSSALLDDRNRKVMVVPGLLPLDDYPAASEVRGVTGTAAFHPLVDRQATGVLPVPGPYLTAADAAKSCERKADCAGVVSQRQGRTIGLLPVSAGASGPSFVSLPGTVTWLKKPPQK